MLNIFDLSVRPDQLLLKFILKKEHMRLKKLGAMERAEMTEAVLLLRFHTATPGPIMPDTWHTLGSATS